MRSDSLCFQGTKHTLSFAVNTFDVLTLDEKIGRSAIKAKIVLIVVEHFYQRSEALTY